MATPDFLDSADSNAALGRPDQSSPEQPHADTAEPVAIGCAILTVSDTRTPETDTSGRLMRSQLTAAGHQISHYQIVRDEPAQISALVMALTERADVQAILLNGGTGIAPRDTTYDAIASRLEKPLPGFGEIFRQLSYTEIGSRAIASRAVAGITNATLIFSVPGSSKAVKLALEALILPELRHLTSLLR
ncbi:MAG: MogA/MoaB family molybdenum cofactor biosynthesis protein [Phormidesmis sp.]